MNDKANIIDEIKTLSLINGTSGDEKEVRSYICSQLDNIDSVNYSVDKLGNIIGFKKGNKKPKNKVMLAAHMDEVGFITTFITDDGFIKFAPVGGIDVKAAIGKPVVFQNGTNGVIGLKAIHLQKQEERDNLPKFEDLYVDIGARDKSDAQNFISLGDNFYFKSEFFEYGDDFIKGKALDDRVGCAILLKILREEAENELHFAFTVQEEVGLRGAKTAAFQIKPDFAIVLETTTACDISGVSGEKQVCKLKNGVVISHMDMRTIYDKELYVLANNTAKSLDIKAQTKTMVAGGNDSGAIHLSGEGVRTLALSLPTRYLHSPACVINKSDLFDTIALAKEMSKILINY